MLDTKDTITTVVVDDEINAINTLTIVIQEYAPSLRIVATAHSAMEGVKVINHHKPHLVFLDIQMPHMNGFDLINTLEHKPFDLVFLTAYNTYAKEAFMAGASHYLLKPINIPDFLKVVKAISDNQQSISNINHSAISQTFENRLFIPSSDGVQFITISDIIRVEASGSYVNVHMLDGSRQIFTKNLKSMAQLLIRHPFFRAHKSHLINVNYIKKYSPFKDHGIITMIDGSETTLSRTRKDEFVRLYKGR